MHTRLFEFIISVVRIGSYFRDSFIRENFHLGLTVGEITIYDVNETFVETITSTSGLDI